MDDALDYASCMRDHGIEMSDPEAEDDGSVALPMPVNRSIDPKGNLAQQPEEYQAAVEACQEILERGQSNTPPDPEALAQLRDDMAAWQECMLDKGHHLDVTVDDNGNISTRNGDRHADRDKFKEDRQACNEELESAAREQCSRFGRVVCMTSAPVTARARAREMLTAEIKATARRHLAQSGASGLSLRAVSRELGMASSAVYRYFQSRDALLTALIIDAFDAVGETAEQSVVGLPDDVTTRWLALSRAVRGWALANPHDYALVYGSPVPGYRAPDDTVLPAARVSQVMLGIVAAGLAAGQIDPAAMPPVDVPAPVHADLANLRNLAEVDIPDEVLARALLVWTGLFGAISYELFGHLHRVVEDYDAYFDHQMRRYAGFLTGS
jgi:AcrR family transcriptional regulator